MTVTGMRKLSRTKPHRTMLMRNMVSQLLQYGHIVSTLAKCKETQKVAERLLTQVGKAKNEKLTEFQRDLAARQVQSRLVPPANSIWPKILNPQLLATSTGGNTRLTHLEPRLGDRAPQAVLEIIRGHIPTTERGSLRLWLAIQATLSEKCSSVEDVSDYNLKIFKQELSLENRTQEQLESIILKAREEIRSLRWNNMVKELRLKTQDEVDDTPPTQDLEKEKKFVTDLLERAKSFDLLNIKFSPNKSRVEKRKQRYEFVERPTASTTISKETHSRA
ncbi:hypothetical protein TBLA_0F01360 [Henningerozyma blattae CBS 6284]|uniref:54S ribosomal protein L8 C-terminal domain-containing protein n=1 Tax=Henningerozyma blattae (strain ATCC 34711 / CBS 6284 / DSM 70876 / NBRC 10599 / NRRL Y-10934 / UCD 77-7) TaxID=1071380 RepID=I2H5M7_HENB6|nr:hypothetical protein TBLA_0F01360 [Tetrapisispora blattae CBS 6284]CCH61679.1 hypothetical protein TBLA_0F01360 [Tetrapisispora blattae CBS 6284]